MFGTSQAIAPPPQKPLGISAARTSTQEAARPVPYFAGTRWLGLTWLGDAWGIHTTPIVRKVGKRSSIVGYNYYASCAGLIAAGPVDRITAIRMNNDVVWSGSITRGAENFVSITIETRGLMHLHWGTETQTLHALLSASGQNHSPYRGQCYAICDDLFFGADTLSAPNVELELSRWPNPSWLTATPNIGNDANPVAVLWDWWTNKRFGLGRSETELDSATLDAAATQLAAEGFGLSPLLTREGDLKRFLIELLEYFDGYPVWTNGLLGIGLVRETLDAIPVIAPADMIDDPQVNEQSWRETFSETRVRFTNAAKGGEEDAAAHQERANFMVTALQRPQTLQRPWATTHAVAHKIASAAGRIAGIPQFTGSLRVPEASLAGLSLGEPFDLQTRTGKLLRCRVNELVLSPPERRNAELRFESDRGWANAEYATVVADAVPAKTTSEPQPPDGAAVIEAPYALGYPTRIRWLYLVARGDLVSTNYTVWLSSVIDSGYRINYPTELPVFSTWAVRAKLTEPYAASTALIDDFVGITFEVLCPDQSLLGDEWDLNAALNHELLAFVGTDGAEIMSLWGLEKLDDVTYHAWTVRALYDTIRASHADNATVWIQLREKQEGKLSAYFSSVLYFKFQPTFGQAEVPLGDITPVTYGPPNARAICPLKPMNLRANGDGSHPTYATGENVTLTWDNSNRIRSMLGTPLNEPLMTDVEYLNLEIRNYAGDTLLDTLYSGPTGATLSSAYLAATTPGDFSVRAYSFRGGYKSFHYDEIKVVKI